MDNLFPQYQIETRKKDGKWENLYFDPDLDIMRKRLEYQRLTQPEGTHIRLLGLKGELIETVEGITLDKSRKKITVEE